MDKRRLLAQLPNALTLLRAVAVVPTLILLFANRFSLALLIFVIAALTDALDGFLARKLSAQSALGRSLDPLADKALVLPVLTALWVLGQLEGVAAFAVLAIFCREVIVLGLRLHYGWIGRHLMPSPIAKAKTFLQMSGTALLLATPAWPQVDLFHQMGSGALALAALLGLASAADYLHRVRIEGAEPSD